MSTKIKFDRNSIKFRLWLYFMSLVLGIVVLIWVLQIFFLNNGYEEMKVTEVDRIATSIFHAYTKEDPNLTKYIQELSISNDFYVMMESGGTLLLFNPEQENIIPVYRYKNQIPKLKEMLEKTKTPASPVSFKFTTSYEKYNTLAYARYLDKTQGQEVFLYIFSPLYPVTSTVNILKHQLLSVTTIIIVLAFFLITYIASRISRPIKSITNTAKRMGKGDYNVTFEGNSYSEINKLAETLNTAAYELGMSDIRQKDLIANVSHDLKTPLTMIRSYAEMIRDLSGDNPEKRNKHLQVIIDETERMSQLVSDMASVSAMRTNKVSLDRNYFDLSSAAASILASYQLLQEQEGYDFIFNTPKECPVYADKSRIEQVISNLTGNAIKYCGEDKVVIVEIKKVGKKYRLEVSDHGPGIKPEELPHVWDRYYKTSTNYVRPTSGTGLGLAIVKEILTLHRCNYGVESKLGKGSTFWFELDAVKREKTSVKPKESLPDRPI